MSVFDDMAADVLEGFGDAITVTMHPKDGSPDYDVRVRWLMAFIENAGDGRAKAVFREVHASGLASALSDARQGDTLSKGSETWKVILPKPQGSFVNLQVALVVDQPADGSV